MRTSASPRTASDPRTGPVARWTPISAHRQRLAISALALIAAAGAGPLLPVPALAGDSGHRDEGRPSERTSSPADAAPPRTAPEVALAEQLLKTIPPGSRIALRPLYPRETETSGR